MKRKFILLIGYSKEDQLLFRLSLEYLTSYFAYYPVRTGKNALTYLQQQRPDMIITDIKIENTNSYELIDTIQNDYNIPIVVVSSEAPQMHLLKQPCIIGYIQKGSSYITWSLRLRKILMDFLVHKES